MDTSKIYPKRDDKNDGSKFFPHAIDMKFIREAILERSQLAYLNSSTTMTIQEQNSTWHSASEMNDIRSKLTSISGHLTSDYLTALPTLNGSSTWLDSKNTSYPLFSSINYVNRALTTTSGWFDYLNSGIEAGKPIQDKHIRTLYWDLYQRGSVLYKTIFPSMRVSGNSSVKEYDYDYSYYKGSYGEPDISETPEEDRKSETNSSASIDLFNPSLWADGSVFEEDSSYDDVTSIDKSYECRIREEMPSGTITCSGNAITNNLISAIHVYLLFELRKSGDFGDGYARNKYKYIPYELVFSNFNGSISYTWDGIPAEIMNEFGEGFSGLSNDEESAIKIAGLFENGYIGEDNGTSKYGFIDVNVVNVAYFAELNLSTSIEKIGWANASAP